MLVDKIINYVKHTPENTNPAVLATLLGDLNKQSDWNQNDSTAADYVKNRPFYTDDHVETVLLEETTAEFTTDNDVIYQTPLNFELLKEGQTYSVSWDGTVYDCVCRLIDSAPFIGNLSIMRKGEDTGEPFVIGYEGWNLIAFTRDKSAFHTISISNTERVLLNEDTFKFDNKTFVVKPVYSTLLFQVMKEGQTYGVSWDGIVYECVCTIVDHAACFGNLSIMGSSFPDTGEPFLIYGDNTALIAFTKDKSASHTISISYFDTQIVKIDEKYLPDSIISDINAAQSTAKSAQSTANTAKSTADAAQSTADAAQSTADAAQSTANAAQSTANAAKTTAENAQTTADNAQSKANTAKTTAENAQTTAENARSIANTAKTEVAKALIVDSSGSIYAPIGAMNDGAYQSLNLSSKDQYHSASFKVTESVGLQIRVGRDCGSQSSVSNSSTVEFIASGAPRMRLKGIDELIMNSSTASSTKKFKITVDDSGTISATEVKQEI